MLPRGMPGRGLWSAASSEILRHMGGVRQTADTAKNQATDALKNARVKTRATPHHRPWVRELSSPSNAAQATLRSTP